MKVGGTDERPFWVCPTCGMVSLILRNYMRPALDRAGMPRMRLHDLRHTYASPMLAAGFSAFEISRWMGYSSAATTTDIYGHLIPVDRSEQILRFEAFVGRG